MRVTDDSARQGRTGKPVFWVLATSLFLLFVAGAGLMMWIGSGEPRTPTQAASESAINPPGVTGSTGSTSDRTPAANPMYPAPSETTNVNRPGTTKTAP
ncbi:MAG TPA: hypothetical protein VEA41_11750 [Salinarimonas sp.]|nr:hypothetical protein [Salinarimonas sp.]